VYVKIFPLIMKAFVWRRDMFPLIITSELDINVWLTSRSGRFPPGKNPVPRKVENIVEHTIAV
jgi:hypothetical protein